MHEFSLLMRRVKKALRTYPSFPYIAVPEYSKDGRLHIHLMLPEDFEFELVQSKWEINGIAESCTVKPGVGLAKMGFYLAKDFDKPVGQRPFEQVHLILVFLIFCYELAQITESTQWFVSH